jgi:hypothetical protein
LIGYSEAEGMQMVTNNQAAITLKQRIQTSPESMRWAVSSFAVADGGAVIAEAIRQGIAVAVCDGSFKDAFGTAAYVLEGATMAKRMVVVLVTPGEPSDQSPYRSELSGLYGVVTMVHIICAQFKITSGAIEVGCDCESALRHVFGTGSRYEADIADPDYDLRSATRKMLANSPITWKWRHVAGHQDDDGIEDLDRWATLNIEMDNLAKVYWNDMCEEPAVSFPVQDEYWPVRIQGLKISSRLDERLREHILGQAQCDRWERNGRLTRDSIARVNWKACEQAMRSLSIGRRHWIAKHVSGHAGVGVKMVQWKMRESAACPRCGEEEDSKHVWTCHSLDARWMRIQHILKLEAWLEEHETQPELRRELINGLKAWSVGTVRRTFHQTPDHIRQVLAYQDAIGWTNLFEGCFDNGWMEAQALYYRAIGSQRSGLRWTVAVIKKLWDVAWDLWEQRNGFLHRAEYEDTLHDTENLDAEIRFQLRRGNNNLPRRTQYLFDIEATDLLQTSVRHRQQWLHSVYAAREMAEERQSREERSMAASRQIMRNWLAGHTAGGG